MLQWAFPGAPNRVFRCSRPACHSSCTDTPDIIDEALDFWRANVLYRIYQHKGGADLILCYLTAYIGELLRFCHKSCPTLNDAKKNILQVSHMQNYAIPGDKNFCLPGFFSAPASKQEAGTCFDTPAFF